MIQRSQVIQLIGEAHVEGKEGDVWLTGSRELRPSVQQTHKELNSTNKHISLEADLLWTELCSLKIHVLKPQPPKRWDLWEVINQV